MMGDFFGKSGSWLCLQVFSMSVGLNVLLLGLLDCERLMA